MSIEKKIADIEYDIIIKNFNNISINDNENIKKEINKKNQYEKIDINSIKKINEKYPNEFLEFCNKNNIIPPKITSNNGKALSAMLDNPYKYWNRESCDDFVKKFNIKTADSIQLFNKHSQWGIGTNSGIEKGKLYIIYPYKLSSKHKMRKNFKYDGDENAKNTEINKIKSTIQTDYINIPNDKWQLGHKNPSSLDNSNNNLILQPPIQSKYRDDYLFFDTLTKMPLPNKLNNLLKSGEILLTNEQIENYINVLLQYKK
jgi:hypothetical protein